jgi:hypothetical protein
MADAYPGAEVCGKVAITYTSVNTNNPLQVIGVDIAPVQPTW